ncbi:Uncharacterised protein [Mycobacterium tuberculosis]|nr:Uncharacterised protein [Mycobacterium tuberculosis]
MQQGAQDRVDEAKEGRRWVCDVYRIRLICHAFTVDPIGVRGYADKLVTQQDIWRHR